MRATAGQHGRIPIVKTSQSFHTEGLLSWDGDETMRGLGKGVRGVFLGDNIPTVTHEEAPYVKHAWMQRVKLFSVPRFVGVLLLPSVRRGTPCPVPPDKCRRPDL